MKSEAERLEQELEELYSRRENPKGASFKVIVLILAICAVPAHACGTFVTGINPLHPAGILITIGIILVFALLVKGLWSGEDKKETEKEITEKTATLANLRSINRDSEM